MEFGNWVPGTITGFAAILLAVLGYFLQKRERQTTQGYTGRTPTPPTTQEVWQRLDEMERVLRSAVFILGEVAEQWPHDHAPILSRRHVAVLAEKGYLPPEWEPKTNS